MTPSECLLASVEIGIVCYVTCGFKHYPTSTLSVGINLMYKNAGRELPQGVLMRLASTYSVTAEKDGLSNKLPRALTSYLGVIIWFKILLHYSFIFPATNLCSMLLLCYCLHSQSCGDCCFMIQIKPFINLLILCRESKGKQ